MLRRVQELAEQGFPVSVTCRILGSIGRGTTSGGPTNPGNDNWPIGG